MIFEPEFRSQTWDFDIFRDVVGLNEYKIPRDLTNFKVIDIGGHIGSFSWLCAQLGCKEIYYCEADKDNFAIGNKWIEKNYWSKKIRKPTFVLFNMVIWKNDSNLKLNFQKSIDIGNTGGGTVLTTSDSDAELLSTFPFDQILKLRLNKDLDKKEKVLLKLDCEGSEYPILFDSKELLHIDYICGEFHDLNIIPSFAQIEGYTDYNSYTLQKFLKENGFLYTYFLRKKDQHKSPLPLGHFWASRTKAPFFLDVELSEKFQDKI